MEKVVGKFIESHRERWNQPAVNSAVWAMYGVGAGTNKPGTLSLLELLPPVLLSRRGKRPSSGALTFPHLIVNG
jgi:hypothetical protein